MRPASDVNATNDAGDTALHAAVSGRGSEVILRGLLAAGADTSAKNKRGQTPADVAAASRKESVAPLAALLRATAKP